MERLILAIHIPNSVIFGTMEIVSRRFYSIYALVVFASTFFVLAPFFFVVIAINRWHKYTGLLNRIWATLFFSLTIMKVKAIFHPDINKKEKYIYCPNHFSYLDIPTMGFTPGDFIFVGKNAMEKVPLFGYMYKKLHITVDRASLRSKHNTYIRAQKAIDEGRSLVMYPEGGVLTQDVPQMARFKNGAFKLAINKQIPIIPVSIPYNWILLPDDDRFLLKRGVMEVVYHAPIPTKGMNLSDLESLKDKVRDVIQSAIEKRDGNKFGYSYVNN